MVTVKCNMPTNGGTLRFHFTNKDWKNFLESWTIAGIQQGGDFCGGCYFCLKYKCAKECPVGRVCAECGDLIPRKIRIARDKILRMLYISKDVRILKNFRAQLRRTVVTRKV